MPKIYFESLNTDLCNSIKRPSPANRNTPEWVLGMSQYFDSDNSMPTGMKHRDSGTVKSCPAIQDVYNFGYIMYTPVDIYIDSQTEGSVKWYSAPVKLRESESDIIDNFVENISQELVYGFPIIDGYSEVIIKLSTLFGVRTDSGYSTWFTDPKNRKGSPLMAIDGVVDTDTFPARNHFAFRIKSGFCGVIKAGTPMIQAIPFRREPWDSEFIDLPPTQSINQKTAAISSVFTNSYKKLFWNRKKFN